MPTGPCKSRLHPSPSFAIARRGQRRLPTAMTEIRNVAADLARFKRRVLVIGLVVLVAFGLLCARLVFLQVVRHEDLAEQAESNRTAVVPVVPNRGLILDRNGVVLASNYSAYTLEITPSKVDDLEDTIDSLSEVVEVSHARPPPFQAPARGLAQLRFDPDPYPPERRGSRALCGAALPLSGRRDQGAAVPQLSRTASWPPTCSATSGASTSARRSAMEEWRRGRPGQLQGHRLHRQAGHRAEL
jgi:hypothetical protein